MLGKNIRRTLCVKIALFSFLGLRCSHWRMQNSVAIICRWNKTHHYAKWYPKLNKWKMNKEWVAEKFSIDSKCRLLGTLELIVWCTLIRKCSRIDFGEDCKNQQVNFRLLSFIEVGFEYFTQKQLKSIHEVDFTWSRGTEIRPTHLHTFTIPLCISIYRQQTLFLQKVTLGLSRYTFLVSNWQIFLVEQALSEKIYATRL